MYSDPADMARSRTREIFMLLTVLRKRTNFLEFKKKIPILCDIKGYKS